MKLVPSILDKINFEHLTNRELSDCLNCDTTFLFPETYLEHPITDEKTLKNSLTHYFFSLCLLQDALLQFLDHNYRKFDALIGNNSCYASSYTIFKIASQVENPEFKTQILVTLNKLENAQNKALDKLINMDVVDLCSKNFRQFLSDHRLVVDLSPELIYLGLAFACCISKGMNDQNVEEIQYHSLLLQYKKLGVQLTKKSMIKLIKHWQKILSIFNVKTLQEDVNPASLWTKYLFGEYVLIDERNRPCLPSLYASKAIYNLLLSMPLALIGLQINLIQSPSTYINRFTILFEVQPDRTLRLLEHEETTITKPIYMFVGCRCVDQSFADIEGLKREFSQRSLEEMLFAHEVTYPQYPKALKAKNIVPKEPELFREINRLKKLKGFSLEDPSDLCLVHIFVDDTQSQALSAYDSPVYLPNLSHDESNDKSCC
jgi:hypothetical protein